MRTYLIVLVAVVLLGVGAAAVVLLSPDPKPVAPSPTTLAFQENNRSSRLKIFVLRRSDDGSSPRLLECTSSRCASHNRPALVTESALYGKNSWYFYQDDELVRLVEGKTTVEKLVTKTPLVAPREMFLSPDGSKLAYFLDNIHDPKSELTELWYIDTETKERRLVGENLSRPDILTKPRWNASSTHLWFIVNSGKKAEEKIEFAIAATSPPSLAARFSSLNWKDIRENLDGAMLDVSFTGRSIAIAHAASSYHTDLTVLHEGSTSQTSVVRGVVPFLEWLPDGQLLYAVQDDSGLSLWTVKSTVHTFAARLPGQFQSARPSDTGEFLTLLLHENQQLTWSAFQIKTNLIFKQSLVPEFGKQSQIIQAIVSEPPATPVAKNNTPPLEDAEITAFIEKNLIAISGQETAEAQRIITTAEANVVYVDYKINATQLQRLLLTIRDAIHPEWSIRARYAPEAGEWRKTEGGGLSDPKPQNVYEWEASLNQWILKSSAK